jgi:hypothetical protein
MKFHLLQKEVLRLSPRSRARLAEKIIESFDGHDASRSDEAWDGERASCSGRGISGQPILKGGRGSLSETGGFSSPRGK